MTPAETKSKLCNSHMETQEDGIMKTQSCTKSVLTVSLRTLLTLLLIGLFASAMFAQAAPKAIPYMTSRIAGGVATNTTFTNANGAAAWNNQIACPTLYNGQTLYAIDQSGDGCLAIDAYVQQPEGVQFDSAGNAYIANVTSPANASIVQKVDAVTGIISLFAGGLTAVVAPSPCASPDPVVGNMTGIVNTTAGDGCPAVDPGYGVTNNTSYTYFKGIRDIYLDSTSTWLYMVDSSNSHVRKVSIPSTPVVYAGTSVARPYAHECEPVYGAGGSNWHADGLVSAVSAKNPYDMTVDSYGNLFIGDESGFSVRLVTPTSFSAAGSTVTPTLGNVTTVMGCVGTQTYGAGSCQTAPSQTANCVGFFTPSSPSTKISRDLGNGEAYGLAFDASGNLYVSDHACYSVYQIPPNTGVSAVTGQTNVVDGTTKVNTPIGASTTTAGSGGTWQQAYSGVTVQGSKMLGFATPLSTNGLYFFVQTNGWFWDQTDTNATATSWAHDIWNSATPFGCAANETMPYDGCPAPNTYIDNGSGMGHGGVDPYGNLYIADYGANLISRASLGTNPGYGPPLVGTPTAPATQTVLLQGASLSDATISVNPTPPWSIVDLNSFTSGTKDCSTFGAGTDGSNQCTYNVSYTPQSNGIVTGGKIVATGTNIPLIGDGSGVLTAPTLTPTGCPTVTYNGTAQATTCTATATDPTSHATVSGSFAWSPATETNAGTYTETGTFTSTNPNYSSGGTVSESWTIAAASPVLSETCTTVTFNGNPQLTCVGDAVGVAADGDITSQGSFGYAPGAETNAGTYTETATFTISNANYVSGGTTTASFVINPATPTLSASCTPVTYNGTPQMTCTGTATGVGAATVSGSFSFAPGAETNAGTYTETATFTSTDPNYASGGTASASFVINPATPTLSASCPTVTYNGTPQMTCTGTATGVGAATVSGSFSFAPGAETNAGTYTEVGTFASADPNYASDGMASASFTINSAAPVLSASCTPVTFNGSSQFTCTATATGVGAATVSGTFAWAPGAETNAGTYTETATFTSTDPNYSSNGTATASFVINPAAPVLSASCPSTAYTGNPQMTCTGTATGVGGATVSGSFSFAPGAETNAATYTEVGTFTSTDTNYSSGGTASASFTITAINPTLSVTCTTVTANGNAQACTPGGSATGIGSVTVAGSWGYIYTGTSVTYGPTSTPPSAAGTYSVAGTFTSGNTNYTGGSATGTYTINPMVVTSPITCTLNGATVYSLPTPVTYGVAPMAFACTTSSTGGTLKYALGGTAKAATYSKGLITIETGTGSVTMLVTQAAVAGTKTKPAVPAATWPASGTASSMTLAPATLTIVAGTAGDNWTFGGSEPKLVSTPTGLFPVDGTGTKLDAEKVTMAAVDAEGNPITKVAPLGTYYVGIVLGTAKPTTYPVPTTPQTAQVTADGKYSVTLSSDSFFYLPAALASKTFKVVEPTGGVATFMPTPVGVTDNVKGKDVAFEITITNTTGADLTFTPSGATDYTVTPSSCEAYRLLTTTKPTVCVFTVTFTPTAAVSYAGETLTISGTDNDAENDLTIPATTLTLNGAGYSEPTASVTGSSFSASGATQTITLTNNNAYALLPGKVTATADLAVTNNCPTSLAGNQTCTLVVTYTAPKKSPPASGSVTIASSIEPAPDTKATAMTNIVESFTIE
jgi:hypothetical protein